MEHAGPLSNEAMNGLRSGLGIATASHARRLRGDSLRRFRTKTAAWLDDSFFKILNAAGVNLLFECGAHEASASIAFVTAGERRAIAIEANPHTFSTLTSDAERFGVVAINCGLGREDGEAIFNVPAHNSGAGNASFLKRDGVEYNSTTVPVTTLNTLALKHVHPDNTIALWLDVEGLAFDVLSAGERILQNPRCRVLKVEVESKRKWSEQRLADEVDRLLTSFGFIPVLRDMEYVDQYNVIYVKRDALVELDAVLLECWQNLGNLRLERGHALRPLGARLKAKLLAGGRDYLFIHRLAALLGSRSSALYLERMKQTRG